MNRTHQATEHRWMVVTEDPEGGQRRRYYESEADACLAAQRARGRHGSWRRVAVIRGPLMEAQQH